jgi:hypothetical protein
MIRSTRRLDAIALALLPRNRVSHVDVGDTHGFARFLRFLKTSQDC